MEKPAIGYWLLALGFWSNLFRRDMQHKRARGIHAAIQDRLPGLSTSEMPSATNNRQGVAANEKVALIERENPTWEDLADDWGKPLPKLRFSPIEQTAGSSLRSE